jgi:hypothetical protein
MTKASPKWEVIHATGRTTFVEKPAPTGGFLGRFTFHFDETNEAKRLADYLNKLEAEILRLTTKYK